MASWCANIVYMDHVANAATINHAGIFTLMMFATFDLLKHPIQYHMPGVNTFSWMFLLRTPTCILLL